jgi:hypothetical protein
MRYGRVLLTTLTLLSLSLDWSPAGGQETLQTKVKFAIKICQDPADPNKWILKSPTPGSNPAEGVSNFQGNSTSGSFDYSYENKTYTCKYTVNSSTGSCGSLTLQWTPEAPEGFPGESTGKPTDTPAEPPPS